MAQQNGKRKQAPAYSADTMALRVLAGLALCALGVMIFMAVDLGMSGNIFQGLRQISFGISGSLAYILGVLPLWAGGLVIWSTQRRAPVQPWIFAMLSFMGICAFVMLISGNALEKLDKQVGGNWGNVIQTVYTNSQDPRTGGGGAMGAALAWPLWKGLGPALGIVIYFLLTVFCLLMAANLTPGRIRDLLTGQASQRRNQQAEERRRAEEQQMLWQQQQAMQQQAMWQQQQAYILEQQQRAQQQAAAPQGISSVENWQEQMTAQQTARTAPAGHVSRIFGRQKETAEEKTPRGWSSRIFGKKPEPYDGLVDGTSQTQIQEEPAAQQPAQRVVTAAKIRKPETKWNTETEETQERPVRRPAEKPAQPAEEKEQPSREAPEVKPQTVPARKPAVQLPETVDRDAYRRPEDRKQPGTGTGRPRNGTEEVPVRPRKPAVPAVQQEIGKEAYTPELKLPVSDKPHEEEPEWFPVPYNYPPITDLAQPDGRNEDTSEEDAMRSRKLEETLANFKVQARVVNVTHGPAISRFEMELAAGIKVSKVAELEKDIAYGMEATSIRIEAPIPGKSLVGVEVPNRKVAKVTLREVLESNRMQDAESLLTVALGKDIAGTPIVCDLAKMPHMLIAGQTGSGKSVCINAIINSLLYRASPDEVKLILVDPKVVELQCYNGIPHLLIPVVNDPHKAAAALAWAVAEMMERYDKFAERGVRNLGGYNAALKPSEKPMARIVIIIDELADLMMVCKKDVEEYICRLTQLARAAGIHLIVATQRPSVDVITGLIKANIPSRIAFKTASSVDSRTILDRNGSEQLLGWGDMLYLPTGSFAPTRVQGCYLGDDEVNRIVTHVREANPSTYDPNILEKVEEIANGGSNEGTGADLIGGAGDMNGGADGSLFEQAVEYAIADGQISTSTLQRRLKVGYARAGRLTDEMEERGIVSAKDGSKPRKCLITREQWEEMKKATEGMG